MKKIHLIIFLIFAVNISYASCNDDLMNATLMEKYGNVDVVFIGKINEGSYFKSDISNGEVAVKVTKSYKGELSKIVIVDFAYFGAWLMRKGEQILIFADYKENGNLYTNECFGSSKIYYRNISFRNFFKYSLYKQVAKTVQSDIKFLNKFSKTDDGKMKFYFDNGIVMAEGELKNGLPINSWTYYYENGKLKSQGKYNIKGQKIETWKYYTYKYYATVVSKKVVLLNNAIEVKIKEYHNDEFVKVYYEIFDKDGKLVVDRFNEIYPNENNKDLLINDTD